MMRRRESPILLLFVAGLGAAGTAAWFLGRRSARNAISPILSR
jgi:hypothetical protein